MGQLQEAEIRLRIKQARKEAGLSQPDLAELLGVIPRTVQNYENDHVPWGRIRDIADITGKSTRWLLHGDGTEDGALAAQLEAIGEKLDRLIVAIAGSAVEQELADAAAGQRICGEMTAANPTNTTTSEISSARYSETPRRSPT